MDNAAFSELIKKVYVLSGIMLIVALVFKYMLQFPFSSPMLIVGGGSLAIAYAMGGDILLKNKKTEAENEWVLNLAGKAIAIGLIGVIFKLMFWPNGMNIVIAAIIILSFIIGAAFWKKTNANKATEESYSKLLLSTMILYALLVFLYFTPDASIIAFQDRGNDELIRLKIQSYGHPENKEYRKQLNDYLYPKRVNDSIK